MLNFLARFCPNLSDVVKALRKFTHKDVPFQQNDSHDKAFVESKKLIAQGPVLCHFSPQLALILQVDVFRVGVGEGFLQNDQPVVFDSNILQATKQCISHSHLQMRVVTRSFRVARVQPFICMQFQLVIK